MTHHERAAEVARLLAVGYLRVKARRDGKSRLERPAKEVHAPVAGQGESP
jgi:hypothetical protein